MRDFSYKYWLLQQIVYLWIFFIALLILASHKIPHRRTHDVINILLALGSLVVMIGIIVVSVSLKF